MLAVRYRPAGGITRATSTRAALTALAVLALLGLATPAHAQTDYYNTDAGRPVQIEDAYAVERRAFEIQAAPVRLERALGGTYRWGVEPELAYGVLPRTQVEVGVPFALIDAGPAGRTTGLAGVDLSVLHNLNVETTIPALAVAAGVLLPAGHLAPDKTYASVKGILTRTLPWARFHVNGEYTFGSAESGGGGLGGQALELSRWLAGVAVDRTLPLQSLLLTGEVYAREPLSDGDEADVEWNTGVGARYQLSPRLSVDGGVGRRLTGDDQAWYVTFGGAVAVGLPWRP